MSTTDGAPFGWDAWLAFLRSDAMSKDVDALMAAIRGGHTLDIGLSIECLASCAFAAGLDAGKGAAPSPTAVAGEGGAS